ncbi:hypothetical protein [Microvirga splendida]|uniref:Uncharacterized protein n=1 Tax=Microvirga splendida TaxID=2795727 RepID=A0ABS0Y5G7_9HYPH|nr:hypothetical protein [Microvirga splendida]MBJ6127554.1 hypothetical protein [Microvirga splendida]
MQATQKPGGLRAYAEIPEEEDPISATMSFPGELRSGLAAVRSANDYGAVINASPELLLTAPIEELRLLFARFVREAACADRQRREEGMTSTRSQTLDHVLAERLENIGTLSEDDLRVAFTFFEGHAQGKRNEQIVSRARAALMMTDSPASHDAIINRWLKYVFLQLWNNRAVQLPLHFKVERSFSKDELKCILPSFVTCHLDHPSREQASFGFRFTLTTPWHDFSEVDLDGFGQHCLDLSKDRLKRAMLGLPRKRPFTPFTATLRTWRKHGASLGFPYTEEDIRNYLFWAERARRGATDLKPTEFIPGAVDRKLQTIRNGRARYSRRRDAAQVELLDHGNREELKRQILEGEKTLHETKLELIADSVNDPGDIIKYIVIMRRGTGPQRNNYFSRMHAFPFTIWPTWETIFERFLNNRRRSGFEGESTWKTLRLLFQDYICCYLPWWLELHPGIEYAIPLDPSDLHRFGGWTDGIEDETAPLPLLRFFDQVRRGSDRGVFNAFINDVHSFFEFCRGNAHALKLRRQDFQNPVVKEVDRVVVRNPSKTNKNPIPRAVVPYLLRFSYAVEEFFNKLTERLLNVGLSEADRGRLAVIRRGAKGYIPSEWDIDVGFEFNGIQYEIDYIPALVGWDYRLIRGRDDHKILLPQVSALRMVIVALETGIRFQGIQWLCQRTFNSLNGPHLASAELVPLVVSTDKVKEKPWKTIIVRRAHDVLLREEAFQSLMADADVECFVSYERREHSRFAPVMPLFRAAFSDYPISDKTYATAWERLIVAFGHWYAGAVRGAEPLRMWRFEADIDPISRKPREEIHVDGDERRPCCPIKLRLKHTPHSARSTFITSRSVILPIEVTGALVGQSNEATTQHYTVEPESEAAARVLAAANSLWEPDPDNPVHIRADRVNSALRRSFEADRLGTEKAFGFHTLSLLNESTSDTQGITLLRSSGMAQIAFRETHICPVGEQCPSDVLEIIVTPRRCGICPIAVKCVEHVTAIGAKRRVLLEQVREAETVLRIMQERGEPDAAMSDVQERRKLDMLEAEGWRTTLLILEETRRTLAASAPDFFVTGMPDAVRLHLRLVSKHAGPAEFIMHRLVDSHAYTSFETPIMRAQAARLRQRLLSSSEALSAEIGKLDGDPVRAFLSSLSVALQAHGVAPSFKASLATIKEDLLSPPADSGRPDMLEGIQRD